MDKKVNLKQAGRACAIAFGAIGALCSIGQLYDQVKNADRRAVLTGQAAADKYYRNVQAGQVVDND
jgi:hypothetical protein